MARTRLRGLEIAGIEIGIEVPRGCEWEWPDSPVADFQCLPRDPEVHIGLRVGALPGMDLGGERYAVGPWTFEIARRGSDWLLGLSRQGTRVQLAHFDRAFRVGEVILSPEAAATRSYPLQSPIDEWIVLHRIVATGGLIVTGRARVEAERMIVRLGREDGSQDRRQSARGSSWLGRDSLVLRPIGGDPRLFPTPWSEDLDLGLARSIRVDEIERTEQAEMAFEAPVDPQEAAEVLLSHAVVPLCDESVLERALRNAQRLAFGARVYDRGITPEAEQAGMPWCPPFLDPSTARLRSEV